MAKTKAELQTQLSALGEKLGVSVDLDQNNSELADDIKDLEGRQAVLTGVEKTEEQGDLLTDTIAEQEDKDSDVDELDDDVVTHDAVKSVLLRAKTTFQVTENGNKILCKKGKTVSVNIETANACIADNVAVVVED